MKIIKLLLPLFLIIAFVAIQNNDANAQCKIKASCSVADDTGTTPICETATFDPCDSWMNWDFYFDRTEQTGSDCTLRPALTHTLWYRTYPSQNYAEGSHHDYGTFYVGSSSSNELKIDRIYLNTGNFTDIKLLAVFVADEPD